MKGGGGGLHAYACAVDKGHNATHQQPLRFSVGVEQIGDGFYFREVHFRVKKRPAGEFARLRGLQPL